MTVSMHSLRLGEIFALALGFGLSSLAVSARVYTKMRLTRTMGKDDYFSVLAWLFFLAYIALAVVIGKHEGSAEHIAHLSTVESAIYSPIMVTVKVSILLQYIALFVTNGGTPFHYSVQGLIWINVLYYTITTILFVTECTPIQKLWKPTMPGHCFSRHNLGVASGVMNVISDFSILILPLPIIWRLQMPWHKKSRVFAVGLLACIASFLRLVYQLQLTHVPPNTPIYQLDVDRIGLVAFAEIAIGIIVGCLPVLPRFFKHLFASPSSSSSSKDAAAAAAASSSRFDLLSSARRTLWRRLLRRPSTRGISEEVSSDDDGKVRGKGYGKPKRWGGAPRIETLDLTRNSLLWEEEGEEKGRVGVRTPESALRRKGEGTVACAEGEGGGDEVDVERGVPKGWRG